MLMRCQSCGYENPVGTAECARCGATPAPLSTPVGPAPAVGTAEHVPHRRAGDLPGHDREFTGFVRDFRIRRERRIDDLDADLEVWSFHVQRRDADGERLVPVPVEMRGLCFAGTVSEGDEVRIGGTWRDGALHAEELDDLTTGARVRAKGSRRVRSVLVAVGFILFVIVAGFVLTAVISF